MQGTTLIAQGPGSVSGNAALGSVTLPAGLAVGNYTIDVSYTDQGGIYSDGGDNSSTLAVTPPLTLTNANDTVVTFSSAMQMAGVSAMVTSPSSGNVVNEGSITFSLNLGNGAIVTGTGFVNNKGQASTFLSLPAGLAVGTYGLTATYNPGPDFQTSADSTHSVIVATPPPPTTTTSPSVASFSTSGSFFGVIVQPTMSDGSAGPGLFLSLFQFPFPVITGVTVNGAGNFDVHIAGLFFGFFPFSMDVIFSPSGSFINVA
jgi:hypothetical protein